MPIPVMKPNELFYSKIIPLLKKEGMSEQTPRKDWPHSIQLRVLKEVMNETPSDLLGMELWCASTCASEWWCTTQTYSRSTAVMCMIGYIIGLGDRHLDNLLVEFSTGQVGIVRGGKEKLDSCESRVEWDVCLYMYIYMWH